MFWGVTWNVVLGGDNGGSTTTDAITAASGGSLLFSFRFFGYVHSNKSPKP
jgi:hypothetical protein